MLLSNIRQLNRCDWFLIAWVLYYLQGILYPEGSIISMILLGVNLLVSAKYAFKVMRWKHNPIFFKGLSLLMLMFTIYGAIYIIINPAVVYYPISGLNLQSYNYIKSIYLSLLPIYPFYYYTKKGYLTEERLQKWGVVFLVSITLTYFRIKHEILQSRLERGYSVDEVTNNTGYMFLSCISLLVMYRKKPLVQFASLTFLITFIIMGMKRGAIAIGAVASAYFMVQAIKNARGRRKFTYIFLSAAICLGTVYFFTYMMTTSDYMMQRVQATMEGNSSGRDDLYSYYWTYFTEKADGFHYLLGRGANGTLEIYRNYAHNDWLEIAVNQGLFGIIVYAVYWVCFYRTWKLATNINAKNILAITIFIFFAKTLFSMSYGDMTYVSTCVLGYALATVRQPNT